MDSSKNSSKLIKTPVPESRYEPRPWYLENYRDLPGPWISHSHFVLGEMVKHLMRNKKDSAIGVKFTKSRQNPDSITNMEGALHTFVNPIVEVKMHGDYVWRDGHSIQKFGSQDGRQLARRVLLSALIQQDFENEEVMLKVARLEDFEFIGLPTLPPMPDIQAKQDDEKRRKYDWDLRRYMIYHLVPSHRLPTRKSVQETAMTLPQTLTFLADCITNHSAQSLSSRIQGTAIHFKRYFISLEVLFMTALHQIRNEFYLLEHLCAAQGYVYTFNPPAIFVRWFDDYGFNSYGTELVSRLHVAALKLFAHVAKMEACRCITWSDFASPHIVPLLREALKNRPHIKVRRWDDLFLKTGGDGGLYVPPQAAEGSMLVIHNNSDAFGQNIETEPSGGSLDGVIGSNSSAAGSLLRTRRDLCDRLMNIPL
jgi:hypothetical protein